MIATRCVDVDSDSPQSQALWQLASVGCPYWLDPGKVIMAMLTGAFDASGDKSTALFCVAGFASSEKDWHSFSEAWSKRLARDEITFFRAVDAAFFTGPFQHWKNKANREDLRRSLFSDLMDILKRHVYHRFGCVIRNNTFDKMSEELRAKFRLTAYTLASLSCERQFRGWVLREFAGANPQMPVRMVFEDGDEGFSDLSAWTTAFRGTVSVSREPKKDAILNDGIIRYGFIPLQAADWLAYELRLALQHHNEGRIKTTQDFRWPFREFQRILGDAGTYDAKDIRDAEQKLAALKTNPEWDNVAGIDLISSRFKMKDT